jgi:hypothetical protein
VFSSPRQPWHNFTGTSLRTSHPQRESASDSTIIIPGARPISRGFGVTPYAISTIRFYFVASEHLNEGSKLNVSANTDSELAHWLHWASEAREAPSFVRSIAESAFLADSPNYALLRPVLLELKRQRPCVSPTFQ